MACPVLGNRPLLLTLLALAGIGACAGPRRPTVRVRNERATSANVQFQDVTGKVTSINGVAGGGASAFVEIAPGVYLVTALIASESVSPTLTFSAARGQHYTVVVLAGTPPALSVEGPLPLSPGLTDP